MQLGFQDPLFDAWAQRPLLNLADGGCELGEVLAVCQSIPDGDRDAWYRAWTALAERLEAEARSCLKAGHQVSARQLFQRASTYYRASYPLLFGAPTDERVRQGYEREAAAFAQAASLFERPVEPTEIPFEGRRLPGYWYSGGSGKRPVLICVNGYDETLHAMHYGSAAAAQRRGYHVLTFDGPGQGRPLIRDGLTMRPDYEVVLAAAIDHVLTLPGVDAERIAVAGWSFGGFLAPRAVSGEPRAAALIADPGQWDMLDSLRGMMAKLGAAELAQALPDVDDEALAPVMAVIEANSMLRWTVVQRGFWVHGVASFAEYIRELARFQVSDRVEQIQCPVCLTQSEGDPLAMASARLYDALTTRQKTLITFAAHEGAGGHCETLARSVYHQRVYDWLDQVFGHRG